MDKEKIQKIIDKLSSPQDDLQAVVNELKELINEKWEPKEYESFWFVDGGSGITRFSTSTEYSRKYGNEFPTQELAETARDMNKRNQLILQAKHEMGYGDGGYRIAKTEKGWVAAIANLWSENPELTFETEEQAQKVISMVGLNG